MSADGLCSAIKNPEALDESYERLGDAVVELLSIKDGCPSMLVAGKVSGNRRAQYMQKRWHSGLGSAVCGIPLAALFNRFMGYLYTDGNGEGLYRELWEDLKQFRPPAVPCDKESYNVAFPMETGKDLSVKSIQKLTVDDVSFVYTPNTIVPMNDDYSTAAEKAKTQHAAIECRIREMTGGSKKSKKKEGTQTTQATGLWAAMFEELETESPDAWFPTSLEGSTWYPAVQIFNRLRFNRCQDVSLSCDSMFKLPDDSSLASALVLHKELKTGKDVVLHFIKKRCCEQQPSDTLPDELYYHAGSPKLSLFTVLLYDGKVSKKCEKVNVRRLQEAGTKVYRYERSRTSCSLYLVTVHPSQFDGLHPGFLRRDHTHDDYQNWKDFRPRLSLDPSRPPWMHTAARSLQALFCGGRQEQEDSGMKCAVGQAAAKLAVLIYAKRVKFEERDRLPQLIQKPGGVPLPPDMQSDFGTTDAGDFVNRSLFYLCVQAVHDDLGMAGVLQLLHSLRVLPHEVVFASPALASVPVASRDSRFVTVTDTGDFAEYPSPGERHYYKVPDEIVEAFEERLAEGHKCTEILPNVHNPWVQLMVLLVPVKPVKVSEVWLYHMVDDKTCKFPDEAEKEGSVVLLLQAIVENLGTTGEQSTVVTYPSENGVVVAFPNLIMKLDLMQRVVMAVRTILSVWIRKETDVDTVFARKPLSPMAGIKSIFPKQTPSATPVEMPLPFYACSSFSNIKTRVFGPGGVERSCSCLEIVRLVRLKRSLQRNAAWAPARKTEILYVEETEGGG